MKKYLLLAAMILTVTAPGMALSQPVPGGAGQGNTQGGPPGAPMGNGENFQEHKAEMLKRMNEHLAEVQQRIRCVEAASNHEALHACMPERGGEGQRR